MFWNLLKQCIHKSIGKKAKTTKNKLNIVKEIKYVENYFKYVWKNFNVILKKI